MRWECVNTSLKELFLCVNAPQVKHVLKDIFLMCVNAPLKFDSFLLNRPEEFVDQSEPQQQQHPQHHMGPTLQQHQDILLQQQHHQVRI